MDTQNLLFAGRYQRLVEVQKGGTAKVYKAFDNATHTVVALKVFLSENRDPSVVNEIWNRECAALTKLEHKAIVRLLDAGRDEATSERYISLEWVEGTTLEEHLKQVGAITWDVYYSRYGAQILDALTHAAERNIIHRDLSTANVLVTAGGALRIIDLGQAKVNDSIVGLTVMGWRTVPYCLPEEDTGRYTHTRDPFSYCAIAVRAISGRSLSNHDELYEEFQRITLPSFEREVFEAALDREPSRRFPTIVEFRVALETKASSPIVVQEVSTEIPIRLAPEVAEKLRSDFLDEKCSAEDAIIRELNELVAVSAAQPVGSTRLELETRTFRLIVDVSPAMQNHLVVVLAIRRSFRLDSLLRGDRWVPEARFTASLPRTEDQFRCASRAIQSLYQGLERHIDEQKQERSNVGSAIEEWTKTLEAQRYLARNSAPVLRYTEVEQQGVRLLAILENPEDAEEQQLRTISVDRSWTFRGEIESIVGDKCVLVSTRPSFDIEKIPRIGTLEIDWNQTKVALDRQSKALEKFSEQVLPNRQLGDLITGVSAAPAEIEFRSVSYFYDNKLDDAKKSIVSRFLAGSPLIVTHGPPGTGKTKLIVELIRQSIRNDPSCRILLVSQTHVALDNALERLLAADNQVSCVRIGSGSKAADERVAKCSLEYRSSMLSDQVARSAQEFLKVKAESLGVSRLEVETGLYVLDVIGGMSEVDKAEVSIAEITNELHAINAQLSADEGKTSDTRAKMLVRLEVVDDQLQEEKSRLIVARAGLAASQQRLASLGHEGKSLSRSSMEELKEWSEVLLSDDRHRSLGDLMRLSEEWRSRFGNSDDFKAAIISSSSVVAGTCVGFCREEAALRTTFDICIVDEAGKATTTELLVPLSQSRRVLLLGDHCQLPPVFDHEIRSEDMMDKFGLTSEQLDVQLFERLMRDLGESARVNLTVQYRMRGEIGRLVSSCFYDNELIEDNSLKVRTVADLSVAGLDTEVTWIDPYPDRWKSLRETPQGTSFKNVREVACIIALLKRILFVLRRTHPEGNWPTIGVISGYAPQVQEIKNEIRRIPELDRLNIDCSSVHAFQGREVDICIYSVTRKNPDGKIGMLKDWRHLNVALSRALNHLVIVGSLDFCRAARNPNPFGRITDFLDGSTICRVKEWGDG